MVSRRCDKDEARKRDMKEMIKKNPGIQTSKIAEAFYLGRRRASTLLTQMTNLGEIYCAGSHNGTGYWISEQAWMDDPKKRASSEPNGRPVCMAPAKRTPTCGLTFLSKKRLSGTNTIFEECKQNSAMLLPVLQVMARRLYG